MDAEKFHEWSKAIEKNVLDLVTPKIMQAADTAHSAGKIFEERVENKIVALQLKVEHLMQTAMTELKNLIKDEYGREIEELEKRIAENSYKIAENSARLQKLENKICGKWYMVTMIVDFFFHHADGCSVVFYFQKRKGFRQDTLPY